MSKDNTVALRQGLSSVREELIDLINQMDDSQWDKVVYAEGEEWRASHLLRHIVSSEKGMTATIENIRRGGSGVPEDFDLARWNARTVTKMNDLTVVQLREELLTNRQRLFALIEDLSDEDLSKRGRHASLRIMSVKEILELIASHEKQHTRDIRAAVFSAG